jgi:hypothetical protein
MRNLKWLLSVLALGAATHAAPAQLGQRGYSPDPRPPGMSVAGAGLQTWFDDIVAPPQFGPGGRDLSDPSAPLLRLQGEMGGPPQFPPGPFDQRNAPGAVLPNLEINPPQFDPNLLNPARPPVVPPPYYTQEKAFSVSANEGFPSWLGWLIPAILAGAGGVAGRMGGRSNRSNDAS